MSTMGEITRLRCLGNEAFNKKDCETALSCYTEAMTLDPLNMTYKLNIAAIYFKQKKFHEAIKNGLDAIETGQESQAELQLLSKAFTLIANSHRKLGDYRKAKAFFEKSLSLFEAEETRTMLAVVEKIIKEKEQSDKPKNH